MALLVTSLNQRLQRLVCSTQYRGWASLSKDRDLRVKRFVPPGTTANTGSVAQFARVVSRALSEGTTVELKARGRPAAWQSLKALVASGEPVDFQVYWADVESQQMEERAAGSSSSSSSSSSAHTRDGFPHVILLGKQAGDGQLATASMAHPEDEVTATTPLARLTKRLSLDLALHREASLLLRADRETAASTALGALATVPSLGRGELLTCRLSSIPPNKVEGTYEHWAISVQEPTGSEDEGSDFRAYPLGSENHERSERQAQLNRSVSQRLERSHTVVMDCRGKDAVQSALWALGRVQGCTAQVEVHWAEGDSSSTRSSGSGSSGRSSGSSSSSIAPRGDAVKPVVEATRSLRVRALPGRPWAEFNSTKFTDTRLLKVSETTEAKQLAAAILAETRNRGAVAVHAFMDDKVAVSTALKAVALVPQAAGQRVAFVPSFGKAKRGNILRLYVAPLKNFKLADKSL